MRQMFPGAAKKEPNWSAPSTQRGRERRGSAELMPWAGPWWNGLGNRGSDFDAEPRRGGGRRGEAEGKRKPSAETAEIPRLRGAARTTVEDWREHNDGKSPSYGGVSGETTESKIEGPSTGLRGGFLGALSL